jgi:hypothetical protein
MLLRRIWMRTFECARRWATCWQSTTFVDKRRRRRGKRRSLPSWRAWVHRARRVGDNARGTPLGLGHLETLARGVPRWGRSERLEVVRRCTMAERRGPVVFPRWQRGRVLSAGEPDDSAEPLSEANAGGAGVGAARPRTAARPCSRTGAHTADAGDEQPSIGAIAKARNASVPAPARLARRTATSKAERVGWHRILPASSAFLPAVGHVA